MKCLDDLDARIDSQLRTVFEEAYEYIEVVFSRPMRVAANGAPEHDYHYWLWYYASLMRGAADAFLTLTTHALSREAIIMARQMFEFLIWATYFMDNREIAETELNAAPLRERALLDEMQFDKDSERYKKLVDVCDLVLEKRPELAKLKRLPSFRHVLQSLSDADVSGIYAYRYKLMSQPGHGTVLAMSSAIGTNDDGQVVLNFDSRVEDPNAIMIQAAATLMEFLELLNQHIANGEITDWLKRKLIVLTDVENRLFNKDGHDYR